MSQAELQAEGESREFADRIIGAIRRVVGWLKRRCS
jgi:hypothetical protein